VGNLRKAVHFARAALGSAAAIGRSGEMLELCPDGHLYVDAVGFEAAARAGHVDALGTYQGELLPEDRYAPWAEEPRERLRALYLRLLKTAGRWERVAEVDPSDEEAHRALMQRAIEAGDRRAAVRQFERLCERLRADLGVGPDRKSVALYERAISMGGPRPPTAAERTRALLARGLVQLNTGELEGAEQAARQARTLAIKASLGREIGEASSLLGIVANLRGEWKQQFRAEFIAAVRAEPDASAHVLDAHLCLSEACLHGPAGHPGITEYARELQSIAERAGSVQGQALAMHRLADAAVAGGRRTHAIELLQQNLAVAERCWLEPHAVVRIHGTLVAATANPHAAARRVEDADRRLERRNVCPPCSMAFRVAAAIAYARSGRLDQAHRRVQAAEPIAGMWPGGAWQAALWEARGALRQAEGDTRRAAALYNEAADQFAELGRPLDRDRCRAAAQQTTGAGSVTAHSKP
jgi:DNA-binding SARP family transcriptional activator